MSRRVEAPHPAAEGTCTTALRTPEEEGGAERGGTSMLGASVKLEARGITQDFPVEDGWLRALEDVTVAAREGEFVSIIGPSGCGKSTLFNILAGLVMPTSGQVLVDGVEVTGRLGLVGYMPQKDLLLPWKTVLDNVALGLELRGVSKKRARSEARALFPLFGLEGFERQYPATLSGGMRQRAALLRTVLARREVLLLDEPFGALDALTRAEMQAWLLDICQTFGKTVIFITHDVDEAIYLSDRVYVMTPRPGSVAAEVEIPLARPRQHDRAVTSQAFVRLKQDLLTQLSGRALEAAT